MALYLNTVSDLLWDSLKTLMDIEDFNDFRIVGGTSLSLQLGHRESVDIDLFTDAEYGSIDFDDLEVILKKTFLYVDSHNIGGIVNGRSYFVGNNEDELVKLDLYYTDPFVFPLLVEDGVRFASLEEIAAMKFEVIANGGRKKDFWDVHELLENFTLDQMMVFYSQRNPYGATREELIDKLIDFEVAEGEFTPNCYKEKDWDIIKLDFIDLHQNL